MFDWQTTNEWMRHALGGNDEPKTADVIAARVLLAAVYGFVAAVIFRLTLARNRPDVRTMPTTLVLLSALIALVSMVIGDKLAQAFGLVGALSIIRFRTVVDDTADTAFVIFAVVIGMAIGNGFSLLATVGLPLIGTAAAIMAWWDTPRAVEKLATLRVRVGLGIDPTTVVNPLLAEHATAHTLVSLETATKGTTVEVTYTVRLKGNGAAMALVTGLNKTDGVQGVELKLG